MMTAAAEEERAKQVEKNKKKITTIENKDRLPPGRLLPMKKPIDRSPPGAKSYVSVIIRIIDVGVRSSAVGEVYRSRRTGGREGTELNVSKKKTEKKK